jgi:hypothetical protein
LLGTFAASKIMLSSVADVTTVLGNMAGDGHAVTPALVARTNPYIRGHILRFGQYALDKGSLPPPLDPKPLPIGTT